MGKRFPIDHVDAATRCAREGFPYGGSGFYNATPGTGSVTMFTLAAPPVGQAMFVQSITVGASRACHVRVQPRLQRDTTLGGVGGGEFCFYYPGSGVVTIPVNALWPGTMNAAFVTDNNDGTTALTLRAGWNGFRVADDLNWDAAKTMLMVGDSIQATGPATGSPRTDLAIWKARDYLRSLGKDYRLVMKQVGGTTSSHAELWRADGLLDVPGTVDLVCYQMGMNNGGSDASRDAYPADLAAFVGWALVRYPAANVLVLAPTPAENATTEARLATIRASASSYVTGLGSARVKYLSLAAAFDRTVAANYASSDTAGSRVHPSTTGNGLIYTAAWKPFIDANASWF